MCSDAELVQNPEDVVTLRRVLHEPASKLVLLGNGVDIDRFHRTDSEREQVRRRMRAELGIDEGTTVVGAVGRLVLEKGYAELFEAWEALADSHPDATLVIVGPDDADKADAMPRTLVERAERAGVRFLGMRTDVEELYPAFDVYVLASHREGFPRSAMEAAVSGLPIVATDIRGCRQVVADGRTGLLVAPRSSEALGAALDKLLGDPGLRARMGVEAARRGVVEFDQRRQIDVTLRTYDRLLRAVGV